MSKLLLDNISLIAGETIKFFILIVTGIVLLDRVKNSTRQLNTRAGALDEWLERIERKIDRLKERIDALTEKIRA
jgi:chaperonin cofactor prefoldin